MNEQQRLKELYDYQILDSAAEKEFNELAELASLICGTPIALITFIDESRQWFKVHKGLDLSETPRKDSFCQHALHSPKEVLVVKDALEDERFQDNTLVNHSPNIRFYAGAPLETPNGNVLGTLCVIDDKPRQISEDQKKALQMLAKKAMDLLNYRQTLLNQSNKIEFDALKLQKLTDQVPGMLFQLRMTKDGKLDFEFVSKGISTLNPSIDTEELEESAEVVFDFVHPEDLPRVQQAMQDSFLNLTEWSVDYRVQKGNDKIEWHAGRATPERLADGSVVWYGTVIDISDRVEYEKAMEQIAFDISHVLRRPVTTLLGLTSLIEQEKMSEEKIKEYSGYIKTVSEELEMYTRRLNETYSLKKQIISGGIK